VVVVAVGVAVVVVVAVGVAVGVAVVVVVGVAVVVAVGVAVGVNEMSTKSTIRYGTGWHVYSDLTDEDDGVVHLEVVYAEGVQLSAATNGETVVTLTIGRDRAKEMGLLK
jgi:hypothetical protein